MTNRELLAIHVANLSNPLIIEHEPERCAHCFHRTLMGEVAKEILARVEVGEPTNAMVVEWLETVSNRFAASRYAQPQPEEEEEEERSADDEFCDRCRSPLFFCQC